MTTKDELDNMMVEILGRGHPVSERILEDDQTLEVTEVFGAAFKMLMAENHQLHNEIGQLHGRITQLEYECFGQVTTDDPF